MSHSAPSAQVVLSVVDGLGPPGTPVTTPEVAAGFDCSNRTVYNRLRSLVDAGDLRTKKVGANSRVWWKPAGEPSSRPVGATAERDATLPERYDRLVESIHEGYAVIERVDDGPDGEVDFRYVERNPAGPDQVGLSRGADTLRGSLGDEADEWCDIYAEVLASGESRRFERPLNSQGRDLEVFAYPIDGSDRPLLGVLFRNVTDRKRRIRALEEAQRQLEAATSAGSVGVWTLDLRDDTVVADEYIVDAYGVPPGAGEDGSLQHYFDGIHPDDREQVRADIDAAIGGDGQFASEFRVTNADGEEMWLHGRGEVEYHEGEPVRVYGAATDVTERKRRERRLAVLDEVVEAANRLSAPEEIMAAAGELASRHLDVEFCHFTRVDEAADRLHTLYQWTEADTPALPETVPLSATTTERFRSAARGGETIVSDDVRTDGLTETDVLEEVGIRSFVSVPFHREGGWRFLLTVSSAAPREWRPDQVKFVRDLANRVFPRLERARTERALRESEERLRRANASLERLHVASQELLDVSEAEIGGRIPALTTSVLGVAHASLWRYGESTGELRPTQTHAAAGVDGEAVSYPDDHADDVWDAFVGGTVDVRTDLGDEDGPLRSVALVPLGRHGVVCAGATDPGAFDDGRRELVETLAATVASAWDRVDGEAELARQNEELERLDQLNGLIRRVDQALVDADSQAEIDQAVCERLTETDRYEFAWIGERDPVTEAIRPRAWAGVDRSFLETVTDTASPDAAGGDPVETALATREIQVVGDVATDTRVAAVREATLERGGRSLVSIPLVYQDSPYGVLTVYANRPQRAGEDRNVEVLAEFGRTVAHASNAIESRATRGSDSVVELTLAVRGSDAPLVRLSADLGCTLEADGYVPRSDGEYDVFFTAADCPPAAMTEAVDRSLGVAEVVPVGDRTDGALYRARVLEPPIAARFVEAGAVVHAVRLEAGEANVVLDLPHSTAVREFLDDLTAGGDDVELLARQSRDRPLKTRRTFLAAVEERFTDRQLEVLRTAYLSGFFESPRLSNGEEVAEVLGVTQPTLSEHLRAAERELCTLLFDGA